MHILLIHQAFAALSEPGGTRHHEMARHLSKMGGRVTVLTGQVSYLTGRGAQKSAWLMRETDDLGVTILRCYSYQTWHRSFLHRIFSFLSFMFSSFFIGARIREVDLVWGTSPPIFQALTAWALARLKGAAFLLEVRDLWPEFAIEVGVLRNHLLIWLSEGLERFLYRHADCVVINSPGFREHVERKGGRNIVVVPNGVEVSMFSPDNDGAQYRAIHGLQDKYVVLYAGAHGMANDLGIFLAAAERLRRWPEIQFILVGDGKEKGNLMEQARNMGLENVHFHPPVAKEEMPDVLASADVCVAILKPLHAFTTTYPNKVFDYMAAGRPIILAIDGVIREVVEEANAGVFVPPGDPVALAEAIVRVEQNREESERMGKAGRQFVEKHYNRAQLARVMWEVMNETVRRKA
jgi:glycosyltransferase involved in cell wall biosynthesis